MTRARGWAAKASPELRSTVDRWWLAQGEGGTLFMLILVDEGMQLKRVDADGMVTAISDVLPAGSVVPSEPGTLFLETQALDASGNSREQRLLQISCKLAGVEIAR